MLQILISMMTNGLNYGHIEADNGWSNGQDMLLSAFLNNNIKIVENGIYELYCVYNMGINSMSIGTFDEFI